MKKSKFRNTNDALQTFVHPQLGPIRVVKLNNDPWFCLNDVNKMLGLKTKNVRNRITDGYLSKAPIPDILGRLQISTVINEAGLYDAILDSRKPEAREFRNWIVSEVLPSIRKDGAYVHATATDTPETLQAKAYQALQMANEHLQKQLASKDQEIERQKLELASLDLQIEEKDLQLEAQQPSVNYAQALLTAPDAITVNEMAKLLTQAGHPIGQNQLFQWLRDEHYLCSRPCFLNLPTQEYMASGYFVVRQHIGYNIYGGTIVSHTTRITPKGQQHFLDRFRCRA